MYTMLIRAKTVVCALGGCISRLSIFFGGGGGGGGGGFHVCVA